MTKHVIAIVGSYRKNGATNQAVRTMLDEVKTNGATVEKIDLTEKNIKFCNNCRSCMQNNPEESRGVCSLKDDMNNILDSIDRADGIILASPINMFSTTALMKQFIERLAVYTYWPWGVPMPRSRKQKKIRSTIIITTSTAPKVAIRLMGGKWNKFLITLAKYTLQSKTIKCIHLDKVAVTSEQELNEKQNKEIIKVSQFLLK